MAAARRLVRGQHNRKCNAYCARLIGLTRIKHGRPKEARREMSIKASEKEAAAEVANVPHAGMALTASVERELDIKMASRIIA